jgi:hypothetical protein
MLSGNLSQKEIIDKCKRSSVLWKEFQDRYPTEDEVNAWWDKWPEANVGIVTGKISNLVVFDVFKDGDIRYLQECLIIH